MNEFKRVTKLTNKDLEKYPVWVFLTEQEEQYDENYIKPIVDIQDINPDNGIYVVRTRFQTNDNTEHFGYCYVVRETDLSYRQPIIIIGNKQVSFWYGMYKPDSHDLEKICKIFKKKQDELFPLHYAATQNTMENKNYGGTIKGLAYLDQRDRTKFVI